MEFDLGRSYMYQNGRAIEVCLPVHDVRSCPIDGGNGMAEFNDSFAGWFFFLLPHPPVSLFWKGDVHSTALSTGNSYLCF